VPGSKKIRFEVVEIRLKKADFLQPQTRLRKETGPGVLDAGRFFVLAPAFPI
jgi:hypothetical protein